jgi:hypothetical protein
MTIFSMLGAIMYVSKVIMDVAPNIHLLGAFIVAFTVVYRKKALYPIYIFVLLTGLFNGFNAWWVPYLYIWTALWAVVMILPKKLPKMWQPLIYMIVSAMHGFLYGILYAPVQALMYGLSFEGTLAWIATGLPWDIMHGISNFFCGIIIVPLISVLRLAEKSRIS